MCHLKLQLGNNGHTLYFFLEQNTAKCRITAVGLLSWSQQGKMTKKGQENKLQDRPLAQQCQAVSKSTITILVRSSSSINKAGC